MAERSVCSRNIDATCLYDVPTVCFKCRHALKDVTDLLLCGDSTDTSSSSDEDDLEYLFLDLAFAPGRERGPRVDLQRIGDLECEQLFRWPYSSLTPSLWCMCDAWLDHLAFIEASTLYRFLKSDLECLAVALQLPEKYRCVQGTVATSMEALLILLRRLVYPNRWCDLIPLFGRSESELSLICNVVNHELVWYNSRIKLSDFVFCHWFLHRSLMTSMTAIVTCWKA